MHTLNNWKIIHTKAPDDGRYVACIEGLVASTNPRFPAASVIRTSYIASYEMQGSAMLVITARRSEYLLGTPHPSEYLTEDFLKSFLPERQAAPAPAPVFDATRSHVIAFAENEYEHHAPAEAEPVNIAPPRPVAKV